MIGLFIWINRYYKFIQIMKENQEEKKKIDQDERGNPLMTVKTIKYYCYKNQLYETPQLNQKLYLHFKGFKKIQSLEHYPNLSTIWLNNNCISQISGLNSLKNLVCLYLNNNVISKIDNLEGLDNLLVLNLAHNKIQKIENLGCLPSLHTINLSQNFLHDRQSLQGMLECQALTSLDLTKNQIENSDNVMNLIFELPHISCLYLKSTPLSRGYKFYRKKLTAALKKLKFLDDRPVQEIDHRICEAWVRGGPQEEKLERIRISEQKQELEKRQSQQANTKISRQTQKQNEKKELEMEREALEKQNKDENKEKISEIDRKLEILREGPKGYQAEITDTSIKVLHVQDREQDLIIDKYFSEEKMVVDKNRKKIEQPQKVEIEVDDRQIEKKVRKVLNLGQPSNAKTEIEQIKEIEAEISESEDRAYEKYWSEHYEPLLEALLEKYKFDFYQVQPSFNMIIANINRKMVRPHRRYQIEELQKIWTGIQIRKRKALHIF